MGPGGGFHQKFGRLLVRFGDIRILGDSVGQKTKVLRAWTKQLAWSTPGCLEQPDSQGQAAWRSAALQDLAEATSSSERGRKHPAKLERLVAYDFLLALDHAMQVVCGWGLERLVPHPPLAPLTQGSPCLSSL